MDLHISVQEQLLSLFITMENAGKLDAMTFRFCWITLHMAQMKSDGMSS